MSEDKLFKHVLDDNSALFKKALDMLNKLEEAENLLEDWKEFSLNAVPTGHVHFDFLGRKRMIERTDRFLGKEGKNE